MPIKDVMIYQYAVLKAHKTGVKDYILSRANLFVSRGNGWLSVRKHTRHSENILEFFLHDFSYTIILDTYSSSLPTIVP